MMDMRRTLTTLAAALALTALGVGSVHSADEELGADLMQSIEDTNKSLASNIATQNTKGAASDAKELSEMFTQVESFYVHKGDAADAVELARKSRTLSGELIKLIGASEFDKATHTATDLSRTCKACHNFYKKS